jgi:hypothetical protein
MIPIRPNPHILYRFMKILLLQSLAFVAILSPLSQAEAKTYGSFQPKTTFTLKVAEITGTVQKAGQIPRTTTTAPAGVPKFFVGQTIRFTIGPKGELVGKGFKIPYRAGISNPTIGVNGYQDPIKAKPSTRKVSFGEILTVNNLVEGGVLNFTTIKIGGGSASTSGVIYSLTNE